MKKEKRVISMRNNVIQKALIRLIIITSMFLLCYFIAVSFYRMGYEILDNTIVGSASGVEVEQIVDIAPGSSMLEISGMLRRQGLIQSRFRFHVQARFYGYTVYPGTYLLSPMMGQRDILSKLSSGVGAYNPEEQIQTPAEELPDD